MSLATLTGGSGAVAVVLSDGSVCGTRGRRLLGGSSRTAPRYHDLCRWGIEPVGPPSRHQFHQFTRTDAPSVLAHGVELGKETWNSFLSELGWAIDDVDKVICHQVSAAHSETILRSLGIAQSRDFSTFRYLGNMGTVSLPLSAGLAADRDFFDRGDRVAFLGIGSGLNCIMLGLEW